MSGWGEGESGGGEERSEIKERENEKKREEVREREKRKKSRGRLTRKLYLFRGMPPEGILSSVREVA